VRMITIWYYPDAAEYQAVVHDMLSIRHKFSNEDYDALLVSIRNDVGIRRAKAIYEQEEQRKKESYEQEGLDILS